MRLKPRANTALQWRHRPAPGRYGPNALRQGNTVGIGDLLAQVQRLLRQVLRWLDVLV